jgi:ferric-dicitrate binding protein FerR (iron transport regulator)
MNDPAKQEEAFAQWLGQQLHDSEEQVDLPTRRRLAQARAMAVAEANRNTRSTRRWLWLPPAAVAAALALVVINTARISPDTALAPPDWVADGESPEFYQALEFIEWLDEWDGEA